MAKRLKDARRRGGEKIKAALRETGKVSGSRRQRFVVVGTAFFLLLLPLPLPPLHTAVLACGLFLVLF